MDPKRHNHKDTTVAFDHVNTCVVYFYFRVCRHPVATNSLLCRCLLWAHLVYYLSSPWCMTGCQDPAMPMARSPKSVVAWNLTMVVPMVRQLQAPTA